MSMQRVIPLIAVVALAIGACSDAAAEPPAATQEPAPALASTTSTSSATTTTSTLPPTTSTTSPPTTTTEATSTTTTVAPTTTRAAPIEPGTERITLEVDGRQREYVLFVPAGLGGGPHPLVVDLHGFTVTGDRHDNLSGMRAKAREEGFVVAQPDAALLGNAWDIFEDSSDVAFIRALVADAAARVPIDEQRIYASGFSAGGGLANRLACDASDLVAAVGGVAGSYIGAGNCAPQRPVPVAAVHGDEDMVVRYDGGFGLLPAIPRWAAAWGDRNGCTATAREQLADDVVVDTWAGCSDATAVVLYTVLGGGHDWPGPGAAGGILSTTESISATDLLWDFFAAHPMPPS